MGSYYSGDYIAGNHISMDVTTEEPQQKYRLRTVSNRLNRPVIGHLYGKQLFTWLSLIVSLMASFCAVLFPTRCLG